MKTLSEMTNTERKNYWKKMRDSGKVITVLDTRKNINNGGQHIPSKNNLRGIVLQGVGVVKMDFTCGTIEFNLNGNKLKAEFIF